jgi:hypothetical protein
MTAATYERQRATYGSPSLRPIVLNMRSQLQACNYTIASGSADAVDPSSAAFELSSGRPDALPRRLVGGACVLRVEGSTTTTGPASGFPSLRPGPLAGPPVVVTVR